jgi:hypothetical protein
LLDLALSILEKLIQTRWKILPREQALGIRLAPSLVRYADLPLGIRHFIVSLIVKNASDERTMRNEKVYINKLNLVLVEVLNPSTLLTGLTLIRFSNRIGLKIGQSSSQKSLSPVAQIRFCVKITWLF